MSGEYLKYTHLPYLGLLECVRYVSIALKALMNTSIRRKQMTPQEIARQHAEVELHFADGGDVEFKTQNRDWHPACSPQWEWSTTDYRKKSKKSQAEIDREEAIEDMAVDILNHWNEDGLDCPILEKVLAKDLYDAGYRKMGKEVSESSLEVAMEIEFNRNNSPLATACNLLRRFHIYKKGN